MLFSAVNSAWMFLSDGRMLAGWCDMSGESRGSVRVYIYLQRGQRLSYLFALGEGRGPVAVVAGTVETQTLADEQCVGDQGDGQFGNRFQGAVGAGEGEFKSGFGHSFLRELCSDGETIAAAQSFGHYGNAMKWSALM